MSSEIVRRATALTGSDGQAPDSELAEIFTPDIVLDLSARVFNPKVYEGYDGLREFYAESREVWEEVDLRIDEIIEESGRYLILGRARARARASGIEIETGVTGMWTAADDGRLRHYRLISPAGVDREAGLAALRAQS